MGPDCLPLLALPCTYTLSYPGQKVLPTTLHYFFPHWTSTYSSIMSDWLGEISKGCRVAVPWETVGPLDTDLLKDFVLLWLEGAHLAISLFGLPGLRLGLIFRFLICASRKDSCQAYLNNHLYKDRSPEL